MRAKFLAPMVISCGLMAAVTPLLAHHGAYGWDKDKPATIAGVITEVEWANPHVYLYVDVKGANGTVENWAVECKSPDALERVGWKRLATGTTVSIVAYPPLSRMALLPKIRTPQAAHDHLASNHYVAGGCGTTSSVRQQLGYGPPCQ